MLVSYPLDGLVPPIGGQTLVDAVSTTIAPGAWDGVGGAGSVRMGIRGTLDVRQSFSIHLQVAQLVADLRQAVR